MHSGPPLVEEAEHVIDELVEKALVVVKPRLRGWLHLVAAPVALVAGIVLVALSPTAPARVAAAVFGLTGVVQFGVSALYHRGAWGPRANATLKRLDHANIFLLIAGSMTPFAVPLLDGHGGGALLWTAWLGAAAGVVFRIVWVGAPRWLYTPSYVALGWVAAFYLPDILAVMGPAVVALLLIGGGLYSVGGLIYALKRPDPSPRWFGFHEVFHALTLAAFTAHYAAISIATWGGAA